MRSLENSNCCKSWRVLISFFLVSVILYAGAFSIAVGFVKVVTLNNAFVSLLVCLVLLGIFFYLILIFYTNQKAPNTNKYDAEGTPDIDELNRFTGVKHKTNLGYLNGDGNIDPIVVSDAGSFHADKLLLNVNDWECIFFIRLGNDPISNSRFLRVSNNTQWMPFGFHMWKEACNPVIIHRIPNLASGV